jgi:endonuclease/exonuclease/phosphatase family metal-dependent hydrolase
MIPRPVRALLFSAALLSVVTVCCCSNSFPAAGPPATDFEREFKPVRGEFSVMTYNLQRFQYDDRNNDGQATEFKPDKEIRAQMAVIASVSPDVLACMEVGDAVAFQKLRESLKGVGLDYPHTEHLMREGSHTHLALLSRFPIVARLPITNEVYSIGTNTVPVQRGFLCVDIQVNDAYRFRLIAAHLKSKRFSTLGQTEMRRNEARLLNKNVRRFLADDTNMNLVVVGDLNDTQNSSAIHEAIGKPRVLTDLRPADAFGDTWTHLFYPEDAYERIDYVLCSPGMAREVVTGKCHVVRNKLTYEASDHRPVVAVFHAQDL